MHKILNHKITLIVSVLALVGAVAFGVRMLMPGRQFLSTSLVAKRDVVESVSVTGKIDADRHLALSFGKPGTIASISVAVGDKVKAGQALAALKATDLSASLRGAQADVAVQEANLASLVKGARPEQVAIAKQSVDTAKLALETAVKDAYLKASDALRNKADILFADGQTVNPQLRIPAQSDPAKTKIENDRVHATQLLSAWQTGMSAGSAADYVEQARSSLSFIKSLIDDIEGQLNLLNSSNSGFSQADLDSFAKTVNAASTQVNGSLAALNTADQAYRTAADQLALTQAPSTSEALAAQTALVAKSAATVSNIESQISDTVIAAPFDGVIASVAPNVGEDVAAHAPVIDLVSDGAYKIEVQIPESDIAKVSEGSPASVTLDAYGPQDPISAHIASIDLSQTVVNGVGSYKAVVMLDSQDPRVRTGMTGRVTVSGRKAQNVLAVPSTAIIGKDGGQYVLIPGEDGKFAQTKVEVGLAGSGFTEIRSGLSEGQAVADFADNR